MHKNEPMKINKTVASFVAASLLMTASCHQPGGHQEASSSQDYDQGSFGYDLAFLKKEDSGVVVLKAGNGQNEVLVSPKYQAKVFTSTARGAGGQSFGWVNYKAFSGAPDAHMNAYGGENRFWLGPEGGKYSLFFKPGTKMVFDNWVTPAPFDTQPWEVASQADTTSVTLHKDMTLENYRGTQLAIGVDRTITILGKETIADRLGLQPGDSVAAVGYQSDNVITNKGNFDWTEKTGMPCIWILDMFNPSAKTVIVIPFHPLTAKGQQVATTNYFGEIPPDRIRYTDSVLYFKADGKSRGKLGLSPMRAKGVAGSYDPDHHVITVLSCDIDPNGRYLNQEWDTVKAVFSGDAQNAYNDGPLADGSQMGPFYEMESVSPAAALKAGASLSHSQSVFHFTGPDRELDAISRHLFGVPLDSIRNAF